MNTPPPPLALRILAKTLEYSGALLLFAMMLLTFVDVIARYFFSRSITGGFEITEIMLATLIFCGLPLITLRDGHITVDLIEGWLPDGFRALRDRFVFLLAAVLMGYLGIQLWKKAGTFVEFNDQTAVLLIPLAPVCYAMAVLTLLSAVISLILAITGYRTGQSSALPAADQGDSQHG
jgi:TRAP-type C4-dicarboxylate transport system permease small subunit